MDKDLLALIPGDTPPAGAYDQDSVFYTYARPDRQVPNLKLYTPKHLGRTFGKHGNYYAPAPNDSFDPAHAFHACIDGMTTTYQKKSVAQAVMEK